MHQILTLTSKLNERLDFLASSSGTTKSTILSKAIALYDVSVEAISEGKIVGIFDQNGVLLNEIVGL